MQLVDLVRNDALFVPRLGSNESVNEYKNKRDATAWVTV